MKRLARSIPVVLAIVSVLACYAFFASHGRFDFRRLTIADDTYYASLAEGFFRGQLHIARNVDARLAALPNPYDMKARDGIYYLWDASYLNGKYYLYSSPLPVLLAYMPLRLVRRAYPPDELVAVIFSVWAFLAAVAFAKRALSGRHPLIPFPLWILFIGLGNVAAFVLTAIHMYEIPILTGMAMTATWAYALLRFNESPSARRAIWVGLWLALAIAARPNLVVLVPLAAIVMLAASRKLKTLLAFIIPLVVVAAAMLWYNAARFGDPLEFGIRYQLTHVSMDGRKVCSLCSFPELARFGNNVMHYVFWPIHIRSDFPFVDAQPARLDSAVSWPTPGHMTEQIIGIVPMAPLMIFGTLFAILFLLGLARSVSDTGLRTAMQVLSGAWLILFGLSACWWIVSRYSLDFMMLLSASAVVCIESGLASLRALNIRIVPLRLAVAALACYSIAMGILIGYCGPGDAFKRANPEMFEVVSGWFR